MIHSSECPFKADTRRVIELPHGSRQLWSHPQSWNPSWNELFFVLLHSYRPSTFSWKLNPPLFYGPYIINENTHLRAKNGSPCKFGPARIGQCPALSLVRHYVQAIHSILPLVILRKQFQRLLRNIYSKTVSIQKVTTIQKKIYEGKIFKK